MKGTTSGAQDNCPTGCYPEGGREGAPQPRSRKSPHQSCQDSGSQKEQQVSPKACASSDCCNTGL